MDSNKHDQCTFTTSIPHSSLYRKGDDHLGGRSASHALQHWGQILRGTRWVYADSNTNRDGNTNAYTNRNAKCNTASYSDAKTSSNPAPSSLTRHLTTERGTRELLSIPGAHR